MTLTAKLDALREGSAKRIPEEKRAVMHRATEDLRNSGIMDGVARIGDPLPAFALTNAHGAEVQSADLLSKGAVVLTVFRGAW